MSYQPDERDLFRRLGEDAQRATMAEPGELRRRTDRRTATRAAIGTVAAVVAVAGIAFGANGLTGSAAPDPADDPTPTESEPIDPVTSAAPPPEGIPPDAWLGKDDLGFQPGGGDPVAVLEPCGRSILREDGSVEGLLSGATRQGSYHAPGTRAVNTPDGTIAQTVLLTRDEKAAMGVWFGFQESVKDCPEETELEPGSKRYSLEEPPTTTSSAQADRTMLVKVSTSFAYLFGSPPDAGPEYIDTYVVVVQVGDAITFLELRGWEASTTLLEDVERLTRLATARLLDWRS